MKIENRDLLGIFLRELKRYPLLSQEEELELVRDIMRAKKIETRLESLKDKAIVAKILNITEKELQSILHKSKFAKDKLVCHNLQLVLSIASKHNTKGLSFADLIQEGALGLIRSTETFDPQRGVKFSAYSYWWIKQSITRAIANYSNTIRLPCYIFEKLCKIRKSQKALKEKLGRNPRIEEIAKDIHVEIKELQSLLEYQKSPLSLNQKVGKDMEIIDILLSNMNDPLDTLQIYFIRKAINGLLESVLSARQKQIIDLKFGLNGCEPCTTAEAAKIIGTTELSVAASYQKAMKKLKTNYNINVMRSLVT